MDNTQAQLSPHLTSPERPGASNQRYRTRDLNEAGAILASTQGIPHLVFEDSTCWFNFDRTAQQTGEAFWSGTLLVNAKAMAQALRELKDRLFAQIRENQNKNGEHNGHLPHRRF